MGPLPEGLSLLQVFQLLYGLCGVRCVKHAAAGNQYIRSRMDNTGGIFQGNTPVNFYMDVQAQLMNHFPELFDLLEGMRYEGLPSESGIDAHDQHGIDILQDLRKRMDGSMGIDGDPRLHTQGLNLLDIAVKMRAGFEVHDEVIGSRFAEIGGVSPRFFYHQVNVTGFLGGGPYLFYDGHTKADIGHKTTVHDVQVEPVRIALIEHFTNGFETEEIGGQEGGCNNRHNGNFQ